MSIGQKLKAARWSLLLVIIAAALVAGYWSWANSGVQQPIAFLHNIITKGGAAVGKAPMMPPFAQLKEQEVNDVVAYIRSLAK